MTQHEYVCFIQPAGLVRAYKRVTFHWATALWAAVIILFILQLWWVGWELRTVVEWTIIDFFILVIGTIFVYGAADLALPTEDYDLSNDKELVFLTHSRSLGRFSALSMLGYFCIGPYVNITMFGNPPLLSFMFPIVGCILVLLIALKPAWFEFLTVLFAWYAILILYLTA